MSPSCETVHPDSHILCMCEMSGPYLDKINQEGNKPIRIIKKLDIKQYVENILHILPTCVVNLV